MSASTSAAGEGLSRLFDPRSVAIVGASANAASVSGQPLANLRAHGFPGALYPVNPRHADIGGLRCYPSIASLPECPDLAIIVVNAASVPGVLRDCVVRGVPHALIVSAGFAETGPGGEALQREIDDVVRGSGIRIVGPNCQGIMNAGKGLYAGFGAAFQIPEIATGPVSLVTQSGGFGFAIVSMAEEAGVGFRHIVCTGNESGVSTLDFIAHFIADPETRIIAAYVEGLKDARQLLELGERALAAGKPIMIWKVGASDAGCRAAISHTANLGGASALYRAVFRQRGMLEIEDVQDLADFARALLPGRNPSGRAAGVVTISGGAGVVIADACAALGIAMPTLSARTKARLREVVPAYASVENPVDVTGNIFNDPGVLPRVLRIVGEDESVDALIVIPALVQGGIATRFAHDIVELERTLGKPVVVCWSAREALAAEAYAILDAHSIPRYPTPLRAARALNAQMTFAGARRRAAERARATSGRRDDESRPIAPHEATGLGEHGAKALLARHGIRVTREALARTRDEAIARSLELGWPVVLKVSSADIPHKTECGAVRVGLENSEEVAAAYDGILEGARAHHPDARIDGVLVQEMIGAGVETIVGIDNDPRFGPAVMFGLGGIFAEAIGDVALRLCPIDERDAIEMIREVRGHALLDGARGTARADVDALAQTLLRVSALAMAGKDAIAELDINPLFVLPEGQGTVAADALIVPLEAT